MVCVELTENKSRQGRAWYFAALPPLSAPLQALSLATGTPVSLIWALRVSSALGVRFDGEKQRGARKKFGSMERLTNSEFSWALRGGVSFPCPSCGLSTPFLFSSDISFLRSVCHCSLYHTRDRLAHTGHKGRTSLLQEAGTGAFLFLTSATIT